MVYRDGERGTMEPEEILKQDLFFVFHGGIDSWFQRDQHKAKLRGSKVQDLRDLT